MDAHSYPSLSAALGKTLSDVLSRTRNADAMKITKKFDDDTAKAQSLMKKAQVFVARANGLMATAHQEAFASLQKLLEQHRADHLKANKKRRKKVRKDTAGASHKTTNQNTAAQEEEHPTEPVNEDPMVPEQGKSSEEPGSPIPLEVQVAGAEDHPFSCDDFINHGYDYSAQLPDDGNGVSSESVLFFPLFFPFLFMNYSFYC